MHRISNLFASLPLAALAFFALTQQALAVDFVNGNFETSASQGTGQVPTPWATETGACDTGDADNYSSSPLPGTYLAGSAGLSNFFVLCLSRSNGYAESFKQEFTVSSDQDYQFDFDWQNMGYNGSLDYDQDGGWDYTLDIKNGSNVISGSTALQDIGNTVYSHSTASASLTTGTPYVITFAARRPTTVVDNKYNYMAIDNVSLSLASDVVNPTLSSSSPADNATGVAVDANIVLNFSEAVDVESGNITIKKTSDDSTIETIDVTSGQVTGTGTTAITINPGSDLSGETEYYVLVDATAFDDAAGNSYAGISSTTALSFTSVDTEVPTITGTTVAADNTTISVTFSEAVYNATGGSGALEVGDFTLSLSGGTATLSSATPSSISISGNVYTLGLSLSGTPDGSEVITVVPSSSTAIYDAANNAAATSQSNNTVSLNDSANPTLLSSTPADDATNATAATNIVLVFSEAVDVESGNITIKKTSDDTIVETIDVTSALVTGSGTSTITVNPAGNLSSSIEYYVLIDATAFDDSLSNSYAGISSTTALSFTVNDDPTQKADVVGSVEAWTNTSSRWITNNLGSIDNRIAWLARNKGTTNTSHQGIKVHFENEVVDAVMNTTPKFKTVIADNINQQLDPIQQAINLLKNSGVDSDADGKLQQALSLLRDVENELMTDSKSTPVTNTRYSLTATNEQQLKSNVQKIGINEAARLREEAIGSLNPSFKPVMGDWSMWTAGQVILGDVDSTSTASKQDSEDIAISLGFDRPLEDDGLIGWMLGIGQSKTEIGTSTTEVESDNYALSGYGVFKQDNGMALETTLGLGHLKFDTTRKDGSDTLTGSRNASQVFTSLLLRDSNIEYKDWSISPYGKATASYTQLNEFSETGASTALTYKKQTVGEAKFYAGADANYLISINSGTIKPFVKLEYGLDLSGGSDATMHYNDQSTNYTLNLDKQATSSWKLGLGADLVTKYGWDGSINYQRDQAVGAGHSDSLSFDTDFKF